MNTLELPRRGRKSKADPYRVTVDRVVRNLPAEDVARLHGISVKHVFKAVRKFLASDDPRAADIKRLTGRMSA